jgi:hypothetical protein
MLQRLSWILSVHSCVTTSIATVVLDIAANSVNLPHQFALSGKRLYKTRDKNTTYNTCLLGRYSGIEIRRQIRDVAILIVGGLDWCSFAPVTTLRYQKSAVNSTGKKLAFTWATSFLLRSLSAEQLESPSICSATVKRSQLIIIPIE